MKTMKKFQHFQELQISNNEDDKKYISSKVESVENGEISYSRSG